MSWCQSDITNVPSTGEIINSDTIINVPISSIRKANVLIIERNYLLDINVQQDSIINLHKHYISEQDSIIEGFKNSIEKTNKINKDIAKKYERERKKVVILGTSTGILAAIVISTILINSLK